MTNALALPASAHLVARDPEEMREAQAGLRAFLEHKTMTAKQEVEDLNRALAEARNNKWATGALERPRNKAVGFETFYCKLLAIVEAGYAIIPDFPIDIFAIRVKRQKVTHQYAQTTGRYSNPVNHINDQESDRPLLGEGRYESPVAKLRARTEKEPDGKGGEQIKKIAFTDDWDEIIFPLRAARPEVMNATSVAMALKAFDQIGICPAERKADPLIIGQVLAPKVGYTQKRVSFLIAWHLDLRQL